jgi:ferric-dicitrate binding protein FerR (iron transport regulator)
MPQVSFELLLKYMDGKASPEEAMLIDDWCAADLRHKEYFDQLFLTWNQQDQYQQADPDHTLQQLKAKLPVHNDATAPKKRRLAIAKIAAAILLPALLVAWYFISQKGNRPYLTQGETHFFAIDTSILLNSDHRIDCQTGSALAFNIKDNIINAGFTGRGQFRISHKEGQKLFLHLNDTLSLEDIGTRFLLSNTNDSVVVRVQEGTVALYMPSDTILLAAGQSLRLMPPAKFAPYADFNLRNISLEEAVQIIQQRLGYTIRISSAALKEERIDLVADHAGIDEVLQMLSATISCKVKK